MAVLEKLDLIKDKLKNMKEDPYSLSISLQLTQSQLERVKGELKKKNVLTESLRKAPRARKRGGRGQGRGSTKAKKRQWYEICARECFMALHGLCTIEY